MKRIPWGKYRESTQVYQRQVRQLSWGCMLENETKLEHERFHLHPEKITTAAVQEQEHWLGGCCRKTGNRWWWLSGWGGHRDEETA